jgi:GNAT superfamily N-acetyltransferase
MRKLQLNDLPYLAEVFCPSWSTPAANRKVWDDYYYEQEEHLRDVFLLEKEHVTIGYGSILYQSKYYWFKEAQIPEIDSLCIAALHRNHGHGTHITHHLENIARNKGFSQIGIAVGLSKDYGPAQKLYAKLGYIPDGNGITSHYISVDRGKSYPVDDDLLLWNIKTLA